MSEISYIAIDNPCEIHENEKVFNGTGQIVAPFTMYEITNETKFSDFASDEHVFVSLLPLENQQYGIFYLKTPNLLDTPTYYFQNQIMTDENSNFVFKYSLAPKPLNITNINLSFLTYPKTYETRQARTGVIENVKLADKTCYDAILGIDNLTDESIITKQVIDIIVGDDNNG